MYRKKIKQIRNQIIKSVLFILIIINGLIAVETGGYAGAFLRMPADARAAALGSSLGGILNDITGIYENPANVPFLKSKQFTSSFQFLSLGRSHSLVGFGTNLEPTAGISVIWIHAGVDEIEGRNYSNNFTKMYSTSQDAIYTTFGIKILDELSFGGTAKILYDKLPNATASGFGLDIGITIIPIKNLVIGIVVKDISGKVKWDTGDYFEYKMQKEDKFPQLYNVNISYNFKDKILFSNAFKGSNTINPTYHYGVELNVVPHFIIRGGVDDGMPVFGIGTEYNAWNKIVTRIDYAFLFGRYEEGVSHIFTWNFKF